MYIKLFVPIDSLSRQAGAETEKATKLTLTSEASKEKDP